MSILLRPAVEPPRLPELSLVAGGAVAEAIAEVTGIDPAIKYPNDVLVGGRKVAGILAEATEGRVVLGIGVNVNQTLDELPPETRRSRPRSAASSASRSTAAPPRRDPPPARARLRRSG